MTLAQYLFDKCAPADITELELNLSAQYWKVEINLEGILELLPTESDFMIN